MESAVILPADALAAADQIIDAAEAKGVQLRLIGGLAFKLLCPSASGPAYKRENKDIDLMGKRDDAKQTMGTMGALGYKPREIFNKLNMGQRLIYYDMTNRRRVDLFLDEFVMCHKFNFKENILAGMKTLPITQLVMTKLQVVERTEKELLDLSAAFHDFQVTWMEGGIQGGEIAGLCAKDWGMYTTFTKTLGALSERARNAGGEGSGVVLERVDRLAAMIRSEPKSLSWKMRARVGERAKWYELPEKDGDAVFG